MTPRRGLLLAALVLLLLASARYASAWSTDNRVGIWLRGRAGMTEYHLLQTRFDGDEAVLARLTLPSFAPGQDLDWARTLGPRLLSLPSVAQVLDPFRLPGAEHPGRPDSWEAASKRPLSAALGIIDRQHFRLDYLLQLDPGADQTLRSELAVELEAIRTEAIARGLGLAIAGHPLIAASLDREARRVETVFAPILAVVAAAGVWLLFRSLPTALLALLPALLATSLLRAGYRAIGWDANLILVSAGPLMLVILLASSLHLCGAYLRRLREGEAPEQAARAASKEKRLAGMLAGLTTCTGFLVFLTSPLEPVRRLGLGVGLGVLLFVPLTYLLLPRLLPLVQHPPQGWRKGGAGPHLADLAEQATRHRRSWLLLSVLLLLAGTLSFRSLDINTNALRYFPEHDTLKQDFLSIESDGPGLTTVEVLLRHDDDAAWKPEDPAFAEVAALLTDIPGSNGAFGAADVLTDLAYQTNLSTLPPLARSLMATAALHASGRLGKQGEWARWTVRMPSGGSDAVLGVVQEIRGRVQGYASTHHLNAVVTGTMPLMLGMQDDLVGTLLRSLGLTLVATFLFFLLVTRGNQQRLAAMVVNLVPVAGSMIAARLLGYELDGASVMVAAVVLSLAVDNTFHLMHAYRAVDHNVAGLRRVYTRVGPPAAISALALGAGFASLALSGFAPTARFGLLTAIGILLSLPADLLLLPALLAPRSSAKS